MRRHVKSTYRSGLEDAVNEQLLGFGRPFGYETEKIPYIKPASSHKYTPDFVLSNGTKTIYIETKGIWDLEDRKKHLLIREQHPELDIRFIFSRSKSKIRKGSKTTYADICNGLGRGAFKNITWQYADKTIPLEWLKEIYYD